MPWNLPQFEPSVVSFYACNRQSCKYQLFQHFHLVVASCYPARWRCLNGQLPHYSALPMEGSYSRGDFCAHVWWNEWGSFCQQGHRDQAKLKSGNELPPMDPFLLQKAAQNCSLATNVYPYIWLTFLRVKTFTLYSAYCFCSLRVTERLQPTTHSLLSRAGQYCSHFSCISINFEFWNRKFKLMVGRYFLNCWGGGGGWICRYIAAVWY